MLHRRRLRRCVWPVTCFVRRSPSVSSLACWAASDWQCRALPQCSNTTWRITRRRWIPVESLPVAIAMAATSTLPRQRPVTVPSRTLAVSAPNPTSTYLPTSTCLYSTMTYLRLWHRAWSWHSWMRRSSCKLCRPATRSSVRRRRRPVATTRTTSWGMISTI